MEVDYVTEEPPAAEPAAQNYVLVPSAGTTSQALRPPEPRSLCHEKTKAALESMSQSPTIDPAAATLALTEYASCIESNVTHVLMDTNEELSFQSDVLGIVANHFENYTCADYDLPTTTPLRSETWTFKDITYEVGIMHDRPRSKIHIVSDFITEEECAAMETSASPILHKATVADGKGGSHFSPHRKAMQAGIKVDWSKEEEGDPIAVLSRRVYDYANHVTGLGIRENGQEDLMSIQYFGRGSNDTEPDRYMPHCDGDCHGMPLRLGNRVATMVLYCTVPEKGGATNFRKAGVHVQPTARAGTFFAYVGSEDLVMDDGFTEHSGCPVIEGEKKIVTQWIRYGVDDENPWDSFNTRKLIYTLCFVCSSCGTLEG